jgi:dihydroxyacetone kinase-like predicted kinase
MSINIKDISHAHCYGHICGFAKQRIYRNMRHISRFVRYIMIDNSRKVIPYGLQRISPSKCHYLDEYTWAEDELRDYILNELKGDSLVLASVEGEDKYGNPENFIKVHFHTNEPWLVLAKGQEMGDIYDVVVENMQRQSDGLKG